MIENNKILISVGELWLKGKNKKDFVARLLNNIRETLKRNEIEIVNLKHNQGKINLECACQKELIIDVLKKISGISLFQFVEAIDRDFSKLEIVIQKIFNSWVSDGIKSVKLKTKRRDKKYKFTSPQINEKLGVIAKNTGLKCDYSLGQKTLNIEVHEDTFFVSKEIYNAMGGLPVGSSGRGLTLLSGGFDSPVAAVTLMNRGVRMDFVHFHTFATNKQVLETKILKIAKEISKFSAYKSKIFVVPYSYFDLSVQEHVDSRMQVIMFKNFMHQFSAKIVRDEGYNLMVNGDSLAQVASQTPENMLAAVQNINELLLRPLIGMNKEEIIELSKKYGLYELSSEKYKDCCSLVAKNPATRVKLDKFLRAYENFPMQEIIEKTYENMDVFEIEI